MCLQNKIIIIIKESLQEKQRARQKRNPRVKREAVAIPGEIREALGKSREAPESPSRRLPRGDLKAIKE